MNNTTDEDANREKGNMWINAGKHAKTYQIFLMRRNDPCIK